MNDLDSALDDIAHLRAQLAGSSRFRGFAPGIVAVTGLMAAGLAAWQSHLDDSSLTIWILLAAISAMLIGTEAVIRARKLHRSIADKMLSVTLNRFLPVATAGAILGIVVLLQAPEHMRLLPGIWQLLMGVGIFAALANLPKAMLWAGAFYFFSGTVSLGLSSEVYPAIPWLMGLPFGFGQLLVALILYLASKETEHGR
jgi:hypothetical protein